MKYIHYFHNYSLTKDITTPFVMLFLFYCIYESTSLSISALISKRLWYKVANKGLQQLVRFRNLYLRAENYPVLILIVKAQHYFCNERYIAILELQYTTVGRAYSGDFSILYITRFIPWLFAARMINGTWSFIWWVKQVRILKVRSIFLVTAFYPLDNMVIN